MTSVSAVEALVALMVAATAVGLTAQRLNIPYTVALLLVGIGLGALGWIPALHLTQGLLMTIFLPALLFEAAIHVSGRELRRLAPSLLTLAIPGVLLAAFATALVLKAELVAFELETSIPFLELLLFGTIIAATDPISVVALFKQLGVEKRLAVLVEGESLLNDGTAIVLFGIVLEHVRGSESSMAGALIQFILVAGGGVLIGAAIGLLSSWITSLIDDPLFEIALTSVTAYGAFLVAEHVHVSGVLAVVIAGLLVGNIGKKRGMSPQSRMAVLGFWAYAAFFINSILFLLLGLEVHPELIFRNAGVVLLAFLAVLAARATSVFGSLPLLRRIGQPIDRKKATVLWWGGLRGGLSMVLVLSLPADVQSRDALIAMTFGVVLLSVVLQGTTMNLLLKRLELVALKSDAMRFLSRSLARLRAIDAQETAIRQIVQEGARAVPGLREISKELQQDREEIVGSLAARSEDEAFVQAASHRASTLREHLREIARDAYRQAQDDNLIDGEDAADLMRSVEDEDGED